MSDFISVSLMIDSELQVVHGALPPFRTKPKFFFIQVSDCNSRPYRCAVALVKMDERRIGPVVGKHRIALQEERAKIGCAQFFTFQCQERHLIDRQTYKANRSAALAEWKTLAA